MYDLDDKKSLNDLNNDWHDLIGGGSINKREALSLLLADNKITGWHASRVLSIDEITSQGLLAYTPDRGLQRMAALCDIVGYSKTEKFLILEDAKNYLNRDVRRSNHVCFYAFESMAGAYSKYAAAYGGETFDWAVEKTLGIDKATKLRYIGEPIHIKFSYSLDRVQDYLKGRIFDKVLVALNNSAEGNVTIDKFDGAIVGSIKPEDILTVKTMN